MTPIDVARAFAAAINRRKPQEISALMTEDHTFVDSLGHRVEGRRTMEAGWAGYFRMVPDYSITIAETFTAGDTVIMLGTAQGTYSAAGELLDTNRWSTPAAWRAQIRDSLIYEWRVYADNEPIRRLMAANQPEKV
jgi:ketosteroid isomerase-like protein